MHSYKKNRKKKIILVCDFKNIFVLKIYSTIEKHFLKIK